jgi:hypothetical protein
MEFLADRNNSLAEVLGRYDTPAYVRRGVQLAHAREQVFLRCEVARGEQLRGVRTQLRSLHCSLSEWSRLRAHLATERDYQLVCELDVALRPDGLSAVPAIPAPELVKYRPTTGKRFSPLSIVQRAEVRALVRSIEWFNRRWAQFLTAFDLSAVNRQVDDYNRYYLLEKECAMRSPRLAARGFVPARHITREELMERYPLVAVPQLS